MNIRKFVAPTARETLKKIRRELGEDANILANSRTERGVVIIAIGNDQLLKLSASLKEE